MPRMYQSRAWSPARSLSVLDLKGRIQEMIRQAERRGGCTDHHELLVKFQADLAAATSSEPERAEACLLLDRLIEDAEVMVTAFEAMEIDAATIAMSMELEGIARLPPAKLLRGPGQPSAAFSDACQSPRANHSAGSGPL